MYFLDPIGGRDVSMGGHGRPWEAMGGGDYNRNFLYPVGGVEVVEMVEMMEIVPRNKYTRHPFFPLHSIVL